MWNRRYKKLFRHGKLFHCRGKPHERADYTTLGCPPEKIRVIKIGIDVSRIEKMAVKTDSPKSPVKILFAGLGTGEKGIC